MLFLRTAAFYFVTALWWVVYWLAVLIPVLAVMFLLPDQRGQKMRTGWKRSTGTRALACFSTVPTCSMRQSSTVQFFG